jgi:hypothetical protein
LTESWVFLEVFFVFGDERFELIGSKVFDSVILASGGFELDVMFFHVSNERHPAFFLLFCFLFVFLGDPLFLFCSSLGLPWILFGPGFFVHGFGN